MQDLDNLYKDTLKMARAIFPWHKRIGIELSIAKSRVYLKICLSLLKLAGKI